MMAQVSKTKKKKLFIIVSAAIILFGLFIFILSYGLSKGWSAVGLWFGSKWAILLYIALGLYALFVGWLLLSEKVKNL